MRNQQDTYQGSYIPLTGKGEKLLGGAFVIVTMDGEINVGASSNDHKNGIHFRLTTQSARELSAAIMTAALVQEARESAKGVTK